MMTVTRARVWLMTLCTIVAVMVSGVQDARAARIKDIAHVQGARENQLIGYGIVVGLDNTGDTGQAALTTQTIASMLGRLNIKIDRKDLCTCNVAAVMVISELLGFARSG
jgi:flagellar P-ring protein precursor FlgI